MKNIAISYNNVMQKILVTGANGFVGNHLVKELADSGYEIVGVGGDQGSKEPNANISEYLTLDLTDYEETKKIDFSKVTSVIHLAGLAAVGASFDNPMLYINTNIGIETNLFEAAIAQKVFPRFLIISSATLYDPKAPLPLNESSVVVPNSPYSVSKLGQEQMGQYYAQRGFEVITARPFNHIGPGQNPGFIVPDLVQQVVSFEKGLVKEVRVGNLDAQRDYTDVRDIVRAYRLLLEKGRSGEIYNVCSGNPLSGHDILEQILRTAGCEPPVVQDPARMRPSDTPVIYGSHDKLTSDTNWQPSININTTLNDVIADWRTRS